MPVQQCQVNGKPGYKWGQKGACYTYTKSNPASQAAAMAKARRQGRAVKAGSS